jgi:hypothetical protein
MYIGYHSPTHLHSFLSGFSFGTNFKSEEVEKPDFDEFHDWIAQRLDYYESTSGWAYMIEDQREDKEEALWLFFELLDEFRGITHESFKFIEYSPQYIILDTSYMGYSRQKKVRGSLEPIPKPRPDKLVIRKINLDEGWYSLVAFNKKEEVLDVRNSDTLDNIFKWGQDIYGINREDWK